MGNSEGKGTVLRGRCLLVVHGDLGGACRGGDGTGLRGDVVEDGLEHVQVGDLGALEKRGVRTHTDDSEGVNGDSNPG